MKSIIDQAYHPQHFREEGHKLIDMLADYLEGVRNREPEQVMQWLEPGVAAAHWENSLSETPGDSSVENLFREVLYSGIKLHHPRYMGHQLSPPAPFAALAGLVNDFMNNGMGVYEMGIPGTAMERAVVKAVARKMGFSDTADGVLTSGGTLANVTALLAARSIKAKTPIWEQGGAKPLALMVSEEAHYCVDRAVRIMGWGAEGIIKVPSDAHYAMRTELLESLYQEACAAGKEVIAVVGSACSTSTGSFDDLEAIGAFAEAHGLWFHVDGAHGAACVYSPKYSHLVKGIHRADSVAMDFHKMLLTPSITTALIFKDGSHSFRTFAQKADYLLSQQGEEDWYNLAKRTFECTKTMLSLRAYTLMKMYGDALFEAYVTRVNDLCADFAALLSFRPGWELGTLPACNILCFRFVPNGNASVDLNALNTYMRTELLEEGRFYIVKTQLRGVVYLRVTLTNPFTTLEDLQEVLERLEEIAAGYPG